MESKKIRAATVFTATAPKLPHLDSNQKPFD
jgi:hypothetical protein